MKSGASEKDTLLRNAFVKTLSGVELELFYMCEADLTRAEMAKRLHYESPGTVSKRIKKIQKKLQELINRKKRDNVRAGTNVPCHRYAGLLQCGECGSCFVSKRRKWRDNPEEIEYVCNGYHRYTKANCSPHRIREKILDELVFNEIISMKDQAYRNFSTVDEDIKRWLKSKSTVDKKVKMLSETLAQRKDDQKEILLSIMRDKAHAAVYEEMLDECEQDIARIEQKIHDIENYSETIKKRRRPV